MIGASYFGWIDWWYVGNTNGPQAGPVGKITGTVTDTADDNSCAWISVQHASDGVVDWGPRKWATACGKGDWTNLPDPGSLFHDGQKTSGFRKGTWKVFLQTDNLRTLLWKQAVATPATST
jgi:hypothetical protein